LIRHASGVFVAGEFHITAQRHPADPPLHPPSIVPGEEGAPEADRETVYGDAERPSGQEMAQLVDGHDNGDDDQKWNDDEDRVLQSGHHM
jgi:hypothetical protein